MAVTDDPLPLPVIVPPGKFTRDLRESIEREIDALIPEGKTRVVLIVGDGNGLGIGYARRVGTSWKLGAEVSRDWSGDVSGQVKVVGSW